LLRGQSVDLHPQAAVIAAEAGHSIVHVAIDGRHVAVLSVADRLREDALPALDQLRGLGLEVAMISGDAEVAARAVATRLGVETVIAGVLPEGKVDAVRDLQQRGKVAFVGDGINDAPVLAAADVGIAVGSGTDIAMESAEVVLMANDLIKVATAIRLSRATIRNIRQNLAWAFGYNTALIPLAAGAFYPFTGLLLSPVFAAAAMAASSLCVLGNALRLRGQIKD
jgi:Cu+-exporting ATPase